MACLTLLQVFLMLLSSCQAYHVTNFFPRQGGGGGDTRVRIIGEFSINAFNTGVIEETPETKVFFVNNFASVECKIIQDSTRSETLIECYTAPMKYGNYYLRVEVEGEIIPCHNCLFKSVRDITPLLQSLHFAEDTNTFAGLPQSLLTINGYIFTDIYSSNDIRSLDQDEISIKRVYAGANECDLLLEDELDTLYGLQLDCDTCSKGSFTCKMKSSFVGNNNFSFVVTEFGRSLAEDYLMRVNGHDTVYMYQTYAEVISISPQIGSINGGTTITIDASYFDPQPLTDPQVFVGRLPCEIIGHLTETELQCVTPSEPPPLPLYPGSRGVKVESWNIVMDLDQARTELSDLNDTHQQWYHDSAGYSFPNTSMILKMSGLFEAPVSDKFQFYVKSDDKSVLYVSCDGDPANVEKVAHLGSYKTTWDHYLSQRSQWMDLTKGQLCYYEGLVQNYGGPGSIDIGALRATTKLTSKQSSNVLNERQEIRWRTDFKSEKQIISLINWTSIEPVNEVQEIQVLSTCFPDSCAISLPYKLQYRGWNSEHISVDASAYDLERIIKNIPTFDGGEHVNVSSEQIFDGNITIGIKYQIVFSAQNGDYPEFSGVLPLGGDVNVTITETVKGLPNFEEFAVNFFGRISDPIPIHADADLVKETLVKAKGAKCPVQLFGVGNTEKFLDYEGPKPDGQSESGHRRDDVPAFCGSGTIRSPYYIFEYHWKDFSPYFVNEYPYFCFAHFGLFLSRIRMQIQYKIDGTSYYKYLNLFINMVPVSEFEWLYECYNIKDEISITIPDAVDIKMYRLGGFSRTSNRDHFYIDAVLITSIIPDNLNEIIELRMPPVTHQGKIIDEIEVNKLESNHTTFEISITPFDCAHDFPLLQVANSREVISSDSDFALTNANNWPPEIEVNVTRIQDANIPMSGTFDLIYDDDEYGLLSIKDIPALITVEKLESRLESIEGFGDMSVSDAGYCYGRRFRISWESNGGDKKLFQVNDSNINGEDDLQLTQYEITNGGVMHGPISGDMTRLYYDNPQVEVIINGIPSICSGDCSFEYSESGTPNLTSSSPESGVSGTNLIIYGTNLDEVEAGSSVMINDEACVITSHNSTTIICTTSLMTYGEHVINVLVGGKGYASHPNPVLNFLQLLDVTAFSPSTSFTTGGRILLITGQGFSSAFAIEIGGAVCEILEFTKSDIKCIVPPSDSELVTDIVLIHNGTVLLTIGNVFTYSNIGMPVVTSLNVTSLGVGGDSIQIQGTDFSTDIEDVSVFIGVSECVISELTNTMIVCNAPYLPSGSYSLEVIFADLGAADTTINSIPNIIYDFKVTGIAPEIMSLFGGQLIEIDGVGFDDDIEVTLGDIDCEIQLVAPTFLTCLSGSTASVHYITNNGVHPEFGTGFAWLPSAITIRQGDIVHWSWELDNLLTGDVGIRVWEVDAPDSTVYNGNGFTSGGIRQLQGSFQHQFDIVGTYYFSSGYVDHDNWGSIIMQGAVHVDALEDIYLELKVSSHDINAELDISPSTPPEKRRKKRVVCEPLNEGIGNCTTSNQNRRRREVQNKRFRRGTGTDILLTEGDISKFLHDHNNARATVNPQSSNMVVMHWDDELAASSALYAQECNFTHSSGRTHSVYNYVGENLAVFTRAGNSIGSVINETTNLWAAEVSNYTFDDNTCNDVCGHYTQVVWAESIALGCGLADCDANVLENVPFDGAYMVVCQYGPGGNFLGVSPYVAGTSCSQCPDGFLNCDETYNMCTNASVTPTVTPPVTPPGVIGSVCFTPTVTSISPRFGTAEDSLIIEGIGFGDDDCRITVTIGDFLCNAISTNNTYIECLPSPSSDSTTYLSLPVTVTVLGYGHAINMIEDEVNRRFTLISSIVQISPVEGSKAGGTSLMITGTGFSEGETSVSVGSYSCSIQSISFFSITCITSAGSIGNYSLNVLIGSNLAVCSNDCEFRYDDDITPKISSVDPIVVENSNTSIEFFGMGFEDGIVTVEIGDNTCVVESKNSTHLSCTLAEISAGLHNIYFHVDGIGYAEFVDGSATSMQGAAIATMTPTSGSMAGGNTIQFTGHGFNSADLDIEFDGSECAIETKTNLLVTCISPPGDEGNANVIIVSNGVTYSTITYLYNSSLTPMVTNISPSQGNPGDEVIITGSLLDSISSTTTVMVGDAPCSISTTNATHIICTLSQPSVGGYQDLSVMVGGRGNADTSVIEFLYVVTITSFTPIIGSIGGGNLITIVGSGFSDDTTIKVGYSECSFKNDTGGILSQTSVAYNMLVCLLETTPSISSEESNFITEELMLSSNNLTIFEPLPSEEFGFVGQAALNCIDCSNSLSGVKSLKAESGNALVPPLDYTLITTITTTDGDQYSVWEPISPSLTYICLGSYLVAGSDKPDVEDMNCVHYLLVEVSNSNLVLQDGSVYLWEVDGSPFVLFTTDSNPPQVFALKDLSQPLTELEVPIIVQVSEDVRDVAISSTNYTFSSLSPVITSVSPSRGGTGGGTNITITGTGFSNDISEISVEISGSPCSVITASETSIQCTTSQHSGSVKASVVVTVSTIGRSLDDGVQFFYIDVWHSPWTWGGLGVPGNGTLVVIPEGQTIMIDQDTAVLEMLLIKGGVVFFDEADIELHATNILITDGGVLQIGTEDEPFQHKGIITLHGHLRSTELPIYGTKAIGVRHGTLDLHGQYVPVTWTHLRQTANIGDSTIVVDNPVTWKAQDQIVIASTGGMHSQIQNEDRYIVSVDNDGVTIHLDLPLEYEHLGVTEVLPDGTILKSRAEVGLLTRNVVVRGSRNTDWDEIIPACPDGFDTGEFAQQTCFQGRFGEELGSDQFGAQIILHQPSTNLELMAFGRIGYVELNYMGQAFRLGRYAIHFHIMGDMNYENYVRGCSIHQTFNRAVTIHHTHKSIVEHNVVYNAMGGSIFIEDGIETENIIQYNLVIFCKQSTSLQNDDITPAGVWITNPNNIVRHNSVAGGTHFGYWYRMHVHPDGPSYTTEVCQQNGLLGEFYNNTAHSIGWYGIWVFEKWTPKKDGSCYSSENEIVQMRGLTAWNCERGAEFVQAGSIQLHDSVIFNTKEAGVEAKMLISTEWGEAGVFNTVIVGHSSISDAADQMKAGIVLPYSDGWMVENTTFINFDRAGGSVLATTKIQGTCADHCGGFHSRFEGIVYHNVDHLGYFRWEHENFIEDLDGSLTMTGSAKTVIAKTDTAPSICVDDIKWSYGAVGGMVCNEVRLHRVAWNNALPTSLEGSLVNLTNQHGRTQVPFERKRMTHKPGWMALLFDGETYDWSYAHLPHLSNITYNAAFYNYRESECNIIRHQLTQTPDRFNFAPGQDKNSTVAPLDCNSNYYGDYHFDEVTKVVEYMVNARDPTTKKRAIPFQNTWADPTAINRVIQMNVFRCFFKDCILPTDLNNIPPARERPADYSIWSDTSIWPNSVLPPNNSKVIIPGGEWIVADIDLPVFTELWIEGVLELDWQPVDGIYKNFTIRATYIFIPGGRLIIGWEDNSFRGMVDIILTGDHSTPDFPIVQGLNMGAKSIGVFGGLDLHGIKRMTTWTTLGKTADVGDSTIMLSETVDWAVGEEIVITPTGFDPWEAETFMIIATDSQNVTLNGTIQFKHLVGFYAYDNVGFEIAGEVGLLSRNIRIIGEEYEGSDAESFGGRVLVGYFAQGAFEYTGYARIADVQFIRMGQEGYSDSTDPRFALAYWKTGTTSTTKPSYVQRCSFFRNFNSAIGAFLANKITFEDNVIYHTVGSSMVIEGSENSLQRNLVTLMINPGTYRNKMNPIWTWFAGIKTNLASSVKLSDNVVAGSERAAFWTDGEVCDNSEEAWGYNTARTSLDGIYMNKDGHVGCTAIKKFNVHHCYDYGMYYQGASSLEIIDCIISDSGVGVITLFNGPSSTSHIYEEKTAKILDSIIIAKTETGICPILDENRDFLQINGNGRSPRMARAGDGVTVGILAPSFMSAHNKAPEKPFPGLMQYPALGGKMIIDGVNFINFGDVTCGSIRHVALMTNPKNEDYMHPIFLSNIYLENSPTESLVFYHYPSKSLIDPSNCVDMECDGMKNMIIIDEDGSFLGSAGTIIPQAEYEWDGDPARGFGSYRIPSTMRTRNNGSQIPVEEIAPNQGILRANTSETNCMLNEDWQAYECHGYKHQLFILESLDWDSETRRISPIALLSEGYIDLENGPQDHGWCAGYTCQRRLSTFFTTVAVGKTYLIHSTGTNPQHFRLRLPHAAENDTLIVGLFYSTSNRLDIYTNNQYVLPKNGYKVGEKVLTYEPPEGNPDFYMPLHDDANGCNYYDKVEKTVYITLHGSEHVDIKVAEVITLAFNMAPVTVDEFFETNLIQNLALLLNIDPENIWIVNIVQEGSNGRRKRQTDTMGIEIAIGTPPAETPPEPLIVSRSVGQTAETTEPAPIDETTQAAIDSRTESFEQMVEIASILTNSIQTGNFSDEIGIEVLSAGVSDPLPPTTEEVWEETAEDIAAGNTSVETLIIADRMQIVTYPGPDLIPAGEIFIAQPVFKILDASGNLVTKLGQSANPWLVSAAIVAASDLNASLIGDTNAPFIEGYAHFSNLGIDTLGEYTLYFHIIYPENLDGLPTFIAEADITINPSLEITENCTEEEGDEKFDRFYTWGENCSFVCLQECQGGDAICSEVECCGPYADCIDSECTCKSRFEFEADLFHPNNVDILLNPIVNCMPDFIEIRLDKCALNAYDFYLDDMYLFGPGPYEYYFDRFNDIDEELSKFITSCEFNDCRGYLSPNEDGVAYSFIVQGTFTDCNAQVEQNETHIIYTNTVRGWTGQNNGLITRERPLEVEFSCCYSRSLIATLGPYITPYSNTLHLQVKSEGRYEVTLAVWKDSSYFIPYDEMPVVEISEYIYIGVFINGVQDAILLAEECYVTPTDDPNDSTKYFLIEEGCAVEDTVTVALNGESYEALFAFQAFAFNESSENSMLHVHCGVEICVDDMVPCIATCSRRKRRELHYASANVITLGPITVEKQPRKEKVSRTEQMYANSFSDSFAMQEIERPPFARTSGIGSGAVKRMR